MYLCAYSNNGLSFRWVLPEWDLEPDEVVFDHELSEAELALVFPGYVFKGWRDLQLSVIRASGYRYGGHSMLQGWRGFPSGMGRLR